MNTVKESLDVLSAVATAQQLAEIQKNLQEINLVHSQIISSHKKEADFLDLVSTGPDISANKSQTMGDFCEEALTDRSLNIKKATNQKSNGRIHQQNFETQIAVRQTTQQLIRSFKKKNLSKCSRVWTLDDIELLYTGLKLFGTDFSMISFMILQNKTAKDILNRFKKEDKKNQLYIDEALEYNRKNRYILSERIGRIMTENKLVFDEKKKCLECDHHAKRPNLLAITMTGFNDSIAEMDNKYMTLPSLDDVLEETALTRN